jgi:hypothetical protein
MAAFLAPTIADIQALRASWATVRGGWGAARSDARQLLAHRRIMVDTAAMTGDGTQTVLRTRIRLSGDTQTDILRGWIATATPEAVAATTQTHFQSVAAAMGGFAAALGMERLATRFTMLAGSLISAAATINRLLREDPALWLHILATHWWLLSGLGFALLAVIMRWLLRWRLRALFRGGLTAQPPSK